MRRHLGRATALGVAARRRKAGNLPLLRTLQDLGVATSLELCLDAGDYASYPGSGYQLLDTSGNDYDFNFGADGGPDTDNPTFNGTAGALTRNEYLSFDGGDQFNYDTTNETWMENIHKDNAAFTIITWLYPVSAGNDAICGTFGSGTIAGTGFALEVAGDSSLRLRVGASTATEVLNQNTASTMTDSAWNFGAVSLDESVGSGGILWNLNGAAETDTSTYTSPSASSSSNTMQIGARGGNSARLASGTRVAIIAVWSRALTATELSDIYTKTRTRFGV